MNLINHQRRFFLKIGLFFSLFFTIISIQKIFKYFRSSQKVIRPLNKKEDKISLLKLSALLIGSPIESLDLTFADLIWTHLNKSPSSQRELIQFLDDCKNLLIKNLPIESIVAIPEQHRLFAQNILRIWYTGNIHTNLDQDRSLSNRRITYDNALMFSSYTNLRPTPGNCYGVFGYWVKPPKVDSNSNNERSKKNE